MADSVIRLAWITLGAYAAVGVALLIPIHRIMMPIIDVTTVGASWGFRVAVSPGLIFMWPLVLRRWLQVRMSDSPSEERPQALSPRGIRTAHIWLTRAIAVAVPLVAAMAIASRPNHEPTPSPAFYAPTTLTGNATGEIFPGLPIAINIRSDSSPRKLHVDVHEDLNIPNLQLYWSNSEAQPMSIDRAERLDALWGPATLTYDLPTASTPNEWLVLYSAARQEVVSVARLATTEKE